MIRRPARQRRREPTIALINVVFLMLIFFLVAGTVARPLDGALRLVETSGLAGAAPADALVVHSDGRLTWRGQPVDSAASYWAAAAGDGTVARLVPDRDLPAATLLRLSDDLRAAGATRIVLVMERGIP